MTSRVSRWHRFLREALRGSDQDFTEGNLNRAIVLLAIPMVLEMAMESIFSICDVFFVSRLGAAAVATVGLTEAVLTLVFAVAVGLSMATTAMVARRIGEHDREGASTTAFQAILVGVLLSVGVGATGILAAGPILELMGASPEVVAVGSGYTTVLMGGSGTVVLLFLNNAIFRGAGDAAVAMRVLAVANGINLVLDPCLIFGLGPFPEMGVTGAAVATTLGRGTGVVLQLWVLLRGTGRIALGTEHLRVVPTVALRLLRVSVGGILQFLIATASWVALVRILAVFGSVALAGYTLAIRIVMFTILPSWGLSNAAATLVGQSLGAGKPDRAEASVWKTGVWNALFMTAVGIGFFLGADAMMRLFTADPEVLAVGATCLRILSFGYPFYAWGMVMVQAFNGAGDTYTPTAINFVGYWLFQIPIAWLLAHGTDLGASGVFWSITLAESLIAGVSLWVFRRGRWKQREV